MNQFWFGADYGFFSISNGSCGPGHFYIDSLLSLSHHILHLVAMDMCLAEVTVMDLVNCGHPQSPASMEIISKFVFSHWEMMDCINSHFFPTLAPINSQVSGDKTIGEPPGGNPAGEVLPVRREVGLRLRQPVVVVARIDDGVAKHEDGRDVLKPTGFA